MGGDDEDDHAFEYARGLKDVSKQSWDACKNEILKILELIKLLYILQLQIF